MKTFMITLLNRKKKLNPLFQTGDVVYGEGKLRDLGMVFKPSFKCLKNKIINLSPAILKLETLLYQNIYIYILFHLILYSQSDFDSKKSGLREKKCKIGLEDKKSFNFNGLKKGRGLSCLVKGRGFISIKSVFMELIVVAFFLNTL